ncbi:MAG: molybdopterin-dependent oxidoreductase [Pseudomonas sp.]|jgi:hypothetical protein|nr:molybdopterin-dependent oxidoreductase [Pseudomonas sp.]MDY0415451.1 molybdopterin-dependent oxidoreductase [Pseudomonas sp.]
MVKTKYLGFQSVSLIMAMLFCCVTQAAENIPLVNTGTTPKSLDRPVGKVILTVDGLISHHNLNTKAQFDLAMIRALPASTLYTSTVVTDGVKRFDGVLMRDLFELLGLSDQALHVDASALNDYLVEIPLADFYEYDVLLATHMDGVLLKPIDKGPLWIVYPRDSRRKLQDIRYDYRWVWQLKHLNIR